MLGPTGAPITLVEFGDYACSFCTETYPVVEKLRSDMDGDLRFVYRHFPVTSPARSRRAAEAAEAAAGQDRFWQMHDLLSTEPGAHLTEDRLLELAGSLDLDMALFEDALRKKPVCAACRETPQLRPASSVDSAPTFFVNGEHFEGPLRAETLLAFAEERGVQSNAVPQ
jgi:protein-disulfide isomerase